MLRFDTGTAKPVTALAFAPDGSRLLAGTGIGPVQEWDAFGDRIRTLGPEDREGCLCVAYSPDSRRIVFSSSLIFHWVEGDGPVESKGFGDMYSPTTGAAFLSDDLVAIAQGHPTIEGSGCLRLYSVGPKPGDRKPGPFYHGRGVRGVDVHRPSRFVVYFTPSQLIFWKSDRPDQHAVSLKNKPRRVAIAPDGQSVALACDRTVEFYSTASRIKQREFTGHTGRITGLAYSPDGHSLLTSSWDGTVREWDVATGRESRKRDWKLGQLSALAYCPDGTRVAIGSVGGQILIWDAE